VVKVESSELEAVSCGLNSQIAVKILFEICEVVAWLGIKRSSGLRVQVLNKL
jgi:acid phosphatase family membrane protein YuiD